MSTLETKRSTEKELLHRWALTSMRFDYHKIQLPTEPEFWKKSRRQRQDKPAAQGSNVLTSGYNVTWFLGGRGDREKLGSMWRDIYQLQTWSFRIDPTKRDSHSQPAAPVTPPFQPLPGTHLCGAEQSAHPRPQPPQPSLPSPPESSLSGKAEQQHACFQSPLKLQSNSIAQEHSSLPQ